MSSVLERVSRNRAGETDFAMRWAFRGLVAALFCFVVWLEWADRDRWIAAAPTIALYTVGAWAGVVAWGDLLQRLRRWIEGPQAVAAVAADPTLRARALNHLVLLLNSLIATSQFVLAHHVWIAWLGAAAIAFFTLLGLADALGRRLGLIKPRRIGLRR